MCRAIVLFATLWALAYNVVGAEITDDSIGNLHLVAVIDGCSVHGSAIAEDNDSCLFFLSDEKGEPVDIGNLHVSWFAQCHRAGQPELKHEYGLGNDVSFAAFKVKPRIWGVTFGKGSYLTAYGVPMAVSDTVSIVCRVSSGSESVDYSVMLKLDVLPPTPTLKIVSMVYDETCVWGDDPFDCSLVTIEYGGSAFDFALSTIRDNGATPPTFVNYDIFDSPDQLPDTVSYSVYYGSSFLFGVSNGYGWSGTEWITPDWEASGISEAKVEAGGVGMSIGNGFCNISSDSPLGNVSVTGLGGQVFLFGCCPCEQCLHIASQRFLHIENTSREREKNLYVGY